MEKLKTTSNTNATNIEFSLFKSMLKVTVDESHGISVWEPSENRKHEIPLFSFLPIVFYEGFQPFLGVFSFFQVIQHNWGKSPF